MLTFCGAQHRKSLNTFSMHSCISLYHYVISVDSGFMLHNSVRCFPQLIYLLLYTGLSLIVAHHLGVMSIDLTNLDITKAFFPNWTCPPAWIFLMKNMVMYIKRNCSYYSISWIIKTGKNTFVPGCWQINFWSFHCRLSNILACMTLKRLISFSVRYI